MSGSQLPSILSWIVPLLALFSIIEARPSTNILASLKEARWNKGPRNIDSYNVPLSNGGPSLPPPTGSVKAIVLGRGTQNYTCAPSTTTNRTLTSPTPISFGATADLFDASPLLSSLPPAEGQKLLSMLPSYLLSFPPSLLTRYRIPLLGKHYFNPALQPVFDLGSTGFTTAKKIANIPAPVGACAGVPGEAFGAVDWLKLGDVGGGRGLSEVYRVETAGGKAPGSCPREGGMVVVQYAAVYWFYG